jgi:hypothetical protein
MASQLTAYQFPGSALIAFTGNNVLAPAIQANSSLALSGTTTLTAVHSAGSNANLSAAYPHADLTVFTGSTSLVFAAAYGSNSAVMTYTANSNSTSGQTYAQDITNIHTTLNGIVGASGNSSTVVFATSNITSSSSVSSHSLSGSNASLPTNASSYVELQEALTELHTLDDDDDWKIQTSVYCSSLQVAAALLENNIPKPDVFSHGSKSVVFNWSGKDVDLYLTISKSKLAVLVSSVDGIEYRTEFSADSGNDTNRFFSALGSARLIAPPKGAKTNPPR